MKTLPAWATHVVIHTNGIDGIPPMGGVMTVIDFLKQQRALFQRHVRTGRGEWDALIYAADADGGWAFRRPFGAGNPYCTLRSSRHVRMAKVGSWSYMDSTRPVKFNPNPTQGPP